MKKQKLIEFKILIFSAVCLYKVLNIEVQCSVFTRSNSTESIQYNSTDQLLSYCAADLIDSFSRMGL